MLLVSVYSPYIYVGGTLVVASSGSVLLRLASVVDVRVGRPLRPSHVVILAALDSFISGLDLFLLPALSSSLGWLLLLPGFLALY